MIHDHPNTATDKRPNGRHSSLPKRLLSIREFGAIYGLGTTSVYGLLKSGALRAVKIGGLTQIRSEDAEAWSSGLQQRIA
jgi:predicted DNA-binding transcriptional regulator AlpA